MIGNINYGINLIWIIKYKKLIKIKQKFPHKMVEALILFF